jgi:Recombinase
LQTSVGNIEYGYRLSADELHVEAVPGEQAALAAIRKLRLGGHSLRKVAGVLNESGHRTRRGTQWRLESVVRAINQGAAKGPQRVA